jgi:hypothetical protein
MHQIFSSELETFYERSQQGKLGKFGIKLACGLNFVRRKRKNLVLCDNCWPAGANWLDSWRATTQFGPNVAPPLLLAIGMALTLTEYLCMDESLLIGVLYFKQQMLIGEGDQVNP